MKKWIATLLAMLLAMLSLSVAFAESEEETAQEWTTPLEIALYARPESEEPTHLTVGNTTKVNGNFFNTLFGNNTSDIDVRTMIHGYSPVVWDTQQTFAVDRMVCRDIYKSVSDGNVKFTINLQEDLTWNDGTPLTARDYVFAWYLSACPEMAAIGANSPHLNILGFDEFNAGETPVFAGIRYMSRYQFCVIIKQEFTPYFYELSQIMLAPVPMHVIAPGCAMRDNGEGAFIVNEDIAVTEPIFTADLLRSTILDPEAGYLSYPAVTCGPYSMTAYDAENGIVDFELNPYYKGNYEGVKPVIDTVTLVPVGTDDMMQRLADGEIDLLNKCVDGQVILQGMQLMGSGFEMANYARMGYGFCALSCEQGPQQFMPVRQALMYAFDTDAFNNQFLMGFGIPVYGYYGVGQWMTGAAMGSIRPIDMTEEEQGAWDMITLDSLNHYDYDLEKAKELLVSDGWTLNAEGGEYAGEGLRYKQVGDTLMPLSFQFAKCAGNDAAEMVVSMYTESLAELGGELVVEEVPFTELLRDYYRENGARKYDMNFMATNFVSTFDPYLVFAGNQTLQGSVNTSGIFDEELIQKAWDMRTTEPGDLLTFLQRWLVMQERFNEVLPTLPLYSNVYFDFHTDWLQNYYVNSNENWAVAIQYAFIAEPEAEPEEELGMDGDEDISFDDDDIAFEDDDISFEDDDIAFEDDEAFFEDDEAFFEDDDAFFEDDDAFFEE